MRPGDVFAVNDPYLGGIHANDVLVFRPVFSAASCVSSPAPSSTWPTWAAPLPAGWPRSPPTPSPKGWRCRRFGSMQAGRANDDVWRILGSNSRTPAKVLGDIHALVAGTFALVAGVEQLTGALRRGGADGLHHAPPRRDRAPDAPRDRRVTARAASTGAFTIDSDGVSPGVRYEVRVAGRARRRRAGSGWTSPERRRSHPGAINASVSQAISGVVYAVRCLLDPSIPMNEGCFRPLDIVLPPRHAGEPEPAGGLRRPAGDGRRRDRGHPRRAQRRPARPRGRGQRADPRLHARRPHPGRRRLGDAALRVRRHRRARRFGRP